MEIRGLQIAIPLLPVVAVPVMATLFDFLTMKFPAALATGEPPERRAALIDTD